MNNGNFDSTVLTLVGKTYDEIRHKLYEMYREDYQIVDVKNDLHEGFFGLFQKTRVKVSYVIKDKARNEARASQEDFSTAKEKLLKTSGVDYSSLAVKQYGQITNLLDELTNKVNDLQVSSSNNIHPSIQKIESLLDANEFSHSYISYISNKLKAEFPIEKLDDFDLVREKVVDWIGQTIKIEPKIFHKSPHVIVLVGPTGLGKTTTISKMAAKPILEAKENKLASPIVRLVTIDHTRVGAEQQLRKFGDIMNVRVDKAENSDDLNEIIQECKDSTDYIFIDTAGYSQNDFDNIAKMRKILSVQGIPLDTYLVVAASTKTSDLTKIIDNFSLFNFNSVIITKCDETTSFGNILSVLFEKNKSVSYITNGQKVPKDMQRASVAQFLYKLADFKINKIHIDDMFPEEN
ncbi:hypothetical protein [Treponema pectinovorum]|uniref:hypothetical protein n=1 Tax=Treponema pectinovorum TaxID=164 RepID=UPI0011C748D4|nr:hypothetical protein [Treponema pectinovorum]